MLPPGGKDRGGFLIIIVAASNADPYPQQDAAIAALGALFGLTLDRDRCHPYSPHASACLGVPPANDVGSWHEADQHLHRSNFVRCRGPY